MLLSMSIERVTIAGGTHGNELTGVYLVSQLQLRPELVAREGFETRSVLTNPRAFAAVRRYVDQGLNRSFGASTRQSPDPDKYEQGRARELAIELSEGVEPDSHVIFDLHTTTSNMGGSIVLSHLSPFNVGLAAWLQEECEEPVPVYHWVEKGAEISGTEPVILLREGRVVRNGN